MKFVNKSNMDQLIAKLEQTTISTISTLNIEDGFLKNFNQVFSFDNNDIKVVGTIDKPYFRAKDVLKILGYSENPSSVQTFIYKHIPEKYKKEKGQLVEVMDFNEAKEIYINEGGLYRLIMRSNKPTAEPFQDFVQDELLPNIRKQIVENYVSENHSLKNDMRQLISEVHGVRKQNQMALQRLEQMGITLDETKTTLEETREQNEEILEELENTNNKLDRALPDRNVDPNDDKLKHHFILFKRKDDETQYMFVRGQDKYIKIKKSEFETEFDITLDKTKTPNPIDMVNRLKDRVQQINDQACNPYLEELKETDEYQNASATGKRSMIFNCKKKYSRLTYRSNKIKLLNFSEEELLKMVRRLDAEKYDV